MTHHLNPDVIDDDDLEYRARNRCPYGIHAEVMEVEVDANNNPVRLFYSCEACGRDLGSYAVGDYEEP